MSIDFDEESYVDRILQNEKRPRVLCEGDSWFATPLGNHLVWKIERFTDFHLLNFAASGDEATTIMAGEQKAMLRAALQEDLYKFELLLFSGGGNDIVGEDLLPLLKQKTRGATWEDCIDEGRLQRRVDQIRLAYLDLIDMRDDHRPECTIMVHGYDFPIPSNRGARLGPFTVAGPWMKPYMEDKGITKQSDQNAIAKYLIQRFGGMLTELQGQAANFVYVKTSDTLTRRQWADEIHPTSEGYEKIAGEFRPHLEALFPDFVE